ncbi:MAG: CCA tRNA nucleotidyltransferase [Nanoarchaeota archaeon]
MKILESIKEEIRPKDYVVTKAIINEFVDKLKPKLKKIGAKAILGGSYAKGTAIRKESAEVDIFVAFNYTQYEKKHGEISSILARVLKSARIKHSRLHGSRDYFNAYFKGIKFELVPILKISKVGQALNITDISSLHVKYVKSKISKSKKLADEIRLAKAFAYGCNCYGAESYIRGFSGYALEILTIHYGSFSNLVRAATKWKEGQIIDPARHYRKKEVIKEKLSESKLVSPLILIDPVDASRNATAALNSEKFQAFISASRKFLSRPREEYFEKYEINVEKLNKEAGSGKKLITVTLTLEKGKEDVVGAKLRKLYESLGKNLEINGFKTSRSEWQFIPSMQKAEFYFITTSKLPEYELHEGPPVRMQKHAHEFRSKWKKVKISRGRLYARIKRKFSNPEDLLRFLIKKRTSEFGIKSLLVRVR